MKLSTLKLVKPSINILPGWYAAAIIYGLLMMVVVVLVVIYSCIAEIQYDIFLWIILYSFSSIVFIAWAKKRITDIHGMCLFYFLLFYILIVFPGKLVYALFLPDLFWGTIRNSENILQSNLDNLNYAYFIFLIGYVPFIAGVLTFPRSYKNRYLMDVKEQNYVKLKYKYKNGVKIYLLITLCVLGLCLKYLSIHYFMIGLPGIRSVVVLIPGFTGVIYFISTACLLFLLTVLLLLAATSRNILIFIFALMLLGVFALIDLSVGWKSPLLSVLIVLCYVAYTCHRHGQKKLSKLLIFGTIILGFVSAGAYIGVQQYRYARLFKKVDEKQMIKIIEKSSSSLKDGLVSIYARVGGLDQLMVTTNYLRKNPSFKSVGLSSMFGNNLTKYFTHKLIGAPEEAVTEFCSNQWGQFMLSVGIYGMIFGMFLLGIALSIIQKLFINSNTNPLLKDAIMPSLFLLYFKIIIITGEFIYISKYVLMLWLTYFFINKLLGSVPRGKYEDSVCG